jgi:hypothetical protein
MFTWASFVIRALAVHALVFGTYNPSGYSYFHWLATWEPHYLALKVLVGFSLIALFWIAIAATRFVLGVVGAILLLAIVSSFGAMIWQFGLLPITFWNAQFLLLLAVAAYLSVGVSSAHFKYRLTGQVQSRVLNPQQL